MEMNSRLGTEKHEPHQRGEQSGSVQTQEDSCPHRIKLGAQERGLVATSSWLHFLLTLHITLIFELQLYKGKLLHGKGACHGSYFKMHQKRAPRHANQKASASSLNHAEDSLFTSPVVFKISRLQYRVNKKQGNLESF